MAILRGVQGYRVWGRNNYFQCGTGLSSPSSDLSAEELHGVGARKILCGSEHCLLLDKTGNLYSWGWNEHGNCGTNSVENIASPTLVLDQVCDMFVGSAHCFAIT